MHINVYSNVLSASADIAKKCVTVFFLKEVTHTLSNSFRVKS